MNTYFKSWLIMLFFSVSFQAVGQDIVRITIADSGGTLIQPDIYGQFAEHLGRGIYDGFYRKGKIRIDVVKALIKIKVPNLRWPGGCFADQYHWRNGIGDKRKRPITINTTWGMVSENNSFGTDEFLRLCRLISCEPYIAGNVGTGSPQEMKDWIEYLNLSGKSALSDLRKKNGHSTPYLVSLWGVGNESWGCGGNMQPEYYANLYKHFAAFCPDYPGSPLKKIISGANADDYHWTDVMMRDIGPENAYGLSLHYYTFPSGHWNSRGSATSFTEQEYAHSLVEAEKIETIINRHEAIMDKYDPQKKMALMVDEWGVWNDVEPGSPKYAMYQQNPLRDALIAAYTLNIFNNHADRIRGANLAQAVNVIQSLVLTKGDKMILTPTYWVFDLFKVHQGARLLKVEYSSPEYLAGKVTVKALNISASKNAAGAIHISLVNLDPHRVIAIQTRLAGSSGKKIQGRYLSSANVTDCNTFANPDKVKLKRFNNFQQRQGTITVDIPPASVVLLTIN